MDRYFSIGLCFCAALLGSSCAKSAHQTSQAQLDKLIPADLRAKVDENVSFAELRSAPTNYVGRTVILSGLALNARLKKDGTEIEILQVPTEGDWTASNQTAKSEGRFLAVQSKGFLDPVVIDKDSPITIVGE